MRNQSGFALLEIVMVLAILTVLGSVTTVGYLQIVQMKWKVDTQAILEQAHDGFVYHYGETGVKIADATGLSPYLRSGQGIDAWKTSLRVNHDAPYAATITSAGPDRCFDINDPALAYCQDGTKDYEADNLAAHVSVERLDQTRYARANESLTVANNAYDYYAGAEDPAVCTGTETSCVYVVLYAQGQPMRHAYDPWGSTLRFDSSLGGFRAAGADRLFNTSDDIY